MNLREWAIVVTAVIVVITSAVLVSREDWYGLAGEYVLAGALFWYTRRTLKR